MQINKKQSLSGKRQINFLPVDAAYFTRPLSSIQMMPKTHYQNEWQHNSTRHIFRKSNRKSCFFWVLLLSKLQNLSIILGIIFGWATGCSIDHGLDPDLGSIKGQIFFSNRSDKVLQETDEVRVAVAKSFPPSEFTELITSNPIDISTGDTVDFELIVPFGTYEILGVVWKKKLEQWNLSDVLGYYQTGFDLLPTPLVVTKEKAVVDSVNLFADFQLVIREASIRGVVHYQGEWPENTEIMGLGAFVNPPDPTNPFSLLAVSSAKIGTPIFVSSFVYTLPVSAGSYGYIGLFWKATNTPFTEIEYLGFYADPDSAQKPGTVDIEVGETIQGIDIFIDFDTFEF